MKVFFILPTFFLAAQAAVPYKDLLVQEWNLFKAEHGKSYASQEEDARRMEIFLENKLFVAQHNAKYYRGEKTFDVELNKFSDWLPEEFNRLSGPKISREGAALRHPDAEMFVSPQNVTIPDEVNWLKAGAVTSVKDQKSCGASYAFSAVGALEGQMFLKKKKKLESLSAQNIVDCSRPRNLGCTGGFVDESFDYVKKNKGINSEVVYPYEAKEGTCRFKSNNTAATCSGYVELQRGEKTLQEAVATVGPIAMHLDTSHKSFRLYKSGVYNEPACEEFFFVDHAMLLVGYGVDPISKKDYWLIKNSWSEAWGEKGYVRVERNANNMCGVAIWSLYPKV